MPKEKYHLLANQYPQGKRTMQTSTRTEDKIHTVLDKNAVYSPTDNQSYQHTERRKKYMQY